MKDIIRLSLSGLSVAGLMAVSMLMPSNTTHIPDALSLEEISWLEFCKARGYDAHDQSDEIIKEFLHTWRGSSMEKEALSLHGIEA